MKLWSWYAAGALLTLLWKLARYVYHGRKMGTSYGTLLSEWFFEASSENAISWITTIGVVWAFGALYIQNLEFQGAEILNKIPDVPAFAFLLGSLMEFGAPNAAKWILSKMPGQSQ